MPTNGNTFAENPPRAPSTGDFNGCAKTDGIIKPNAARDPNAPEWNTMTATLVGIAATGAYLLVAVRVSGAAFVVDKFVCANPNVGAASFSPATPSVGVCELTLPAALFPAAHRAPPLVTILGATPGLITAEELPAGVRVRTFNPGGAPTSLPFVVAVT